jgi:hypothetical protein
LPGDANRAIALLGEAALVEDQRAVGLAAQQAVGIMGNLFDDRFVPPRRVADDVLELLRAAALNHAGHRSERGRLRLRQAMQLALRHRRVVGPAAAEEQTVAVDETCKRIGDAIDQRCGQRSSAHTVTRRIDPLTSPSQFRMSCRPIGSAWECDVKRSGGRAGRTARGFAVTVPHAVAVTISSKLAGEHSA